MLGPDAWPWFLVGTLAAAAWVLGYVLNRQGVSRHHLTGDPRRGVVIFVEPVRWLFIIWGFAHFCRGLRRSGFQGQIRLFRWCTGVGSLLVVPDLVRDRRLRRKAAALARHVRQLADELPGRPVSLIGYSSGCYVVLEACLRLDRLDTVSSVILMAGAVSPGYPLSALTGRVRRIHSFHSPIDMIVGVGPLLFGGNDRRWAPGCGAIGFHDAPAFVSQRGWRLGDARLGYYGDHFTIASSRFVARHIAPLLESE